MGQIVMWGTLYWSRQDGMEVSEVRSVYGQGEVKKNRVRLGYSVSG